MKPEHVVPNTEVTETRLLAAAVIDYLGDDILAVLRDVSGDPFARSEAIVATLRLLTYLNHELDELQEAFPDDDAWCLREPD